MLRASLRVSPRPSAALLRRLFAADGARVAAILNRHAPDGVEVVSDIQYGPDPEDMLDLFRPAGASGPLPAVVWIHGGGFLGGSKEQPAGYLRILAAVGLTVVAPQYRLAPAHHYPAPVGQLADALGFLAHQAPALGIDASRLVLAGDSAGAQLAAQLAALGTTPGYADAVGIRYPGDARSLRGLILCCGPYDLALADGTSGPAERWFLDTVLQAYCGRRDVRADTAFALASIAEHISPAFPPALVTVGNADPLRMHSVRLVERLRADRIPVETVFYAADHTPPLAHEYQFELDRPEAQAFLAATVLFLRRHLLDGPPSDAPSPRIW